MKSIKSAIINTLEHHTNIACDEAVKLMKEGKKLSWLKYRGMRALIRLYLHVNTWF